MRALAAALGSLALAGPFVACAATEPEPPVALDPGSASSDDPSRRPATIAELERSLAEGRAGAAAIAATLAELHACEATLGPSSAGDSHWVATLSHASRARGGSSASPEGAKLALLSALAYSRLGFPDEAGKFLADLPEIQRAREALALFDRLAVPRVLLPWMCVAAFDRAKGIDELEAYRFAILALEGEERFGRALPEPETKRLEDWILSGASVEFVCPESHTPYVPHLTKSPISGIPHFDYVAVERKKHP